MQFKKDFLINLGFLVVSLVIYTIYTFPTQLILGGSPYSIAGWEHKIILAIALELIVSITGMYLFKKLLDTSKVLAIEIEKLTFQYLGGGFFYASIASSVLIAGQIAMLYFDRSFSPTSPFGMLYPLSLFLASISVGTAAYYYFNFVYLMCKKERSPSMVKTIIQVAILVLIIISLHPYSWFGMNNPESTLYLRTAVHLALLVIYAPVLVYTVYQFLNKLRAITDTTIRRRYKVLLNGFIAMIGFFIFSAIDALYGELYTLWIYLAYISADISFILLYIGTVAPRLR